MEILLSPGKYIQGMGVLRNLADYIDKPAFVMADGFVMGIVYEIINRGFKTKNIPAHFEIFNGECSLIEINKLKDVVLESSSKIIVGLGGGKILDTAKALAFFCDLPLVVVPTVASTDAPCSALSVLYHDNGVFHKYLFLPKNPDIVLVDTEIISKAPIRLLVSGMGDAIATYFEAKACEKAHAKNMAGGYCTKASIAIAKLCLETLLENGEKALHAVKNGVCTKAVENIIEANIYLSGIGFESGGLAAAHSIHNGLNVIPECHQLYHGEKVAFGTIVQLFLEDAPLEEIKLIVGFCKKMGLPITFKDLKIENINNDLLMKVAEVSCLEGETIHNMPFKVTPTMVYTALLTANSFGESFL